MERHGSRHIGTKEKVSFFVRFFCKVDIILSLINFMAVRGRE